MAGPASPAPRPIVWSSRTDRRTSRPSTGGASTLRRDAGRRRSRHTCLMRRSVDDPLVRQAARRAATRGTLIAQEPLDVRDEVVARRQALLVVHRLEPLDVAACRLVQAGRRVEPGAQLARLLGRARAPGSRRRGACPPRAAARGPPSRTVPTRSAGPGRSSRGPARPPPRPRSRAPTRAPTARATCPPARR